MSDVVTGKREYFGLKPFNAHPWRVISDALFDDREALFEPCLLRYGLPRPLVRRWLALHELVRRAIVKSTGRGMVIGGAELPTGGFSAATVDAASVCDGCGAEMRTGAAGHLHQRTGELFCTACAARLVGATGAPPPLP